MSIFFVLFIFILGVFLGYGYCYGRYAPKDNGWGWFKEHYPDSYKRLLSKHKK